MCFLDCLFFVHRISDFGAAVGRQLMKTGAIRVNGKQPMNGALAPLTQEEVYGGKVAVVKLGAAKHCTLLVDG
jgi:hypothetical protein